MASNSFPVAVVGMAIKLPGANSCSEFWELIKNEEDTVGEFPPQRAADIEHVLTHFRSQLVDKQNPFYSGSFFQSIDKFDAGIFQINPREALFLEPEQRLFLEATWELFEDAGCASRIRGSNTGVYVGNTVNKYKYILTENHPSISHGNHSPFIASRISYVHDLQGPAMMVPTGCSSSMLAVHLACQGLKSGDCDMAVAGGITLDLLPLNTTTDIWNQLNTTGPDVKCRAFDATAKGIAKGEGCGVVLLKPLQKALLDNDHIYGILEVTVTNQDGHSNDITAPHPGSQAKMLHKAWKQANITPDQLIYFEAYGTGTELGDPIEISSITNAFRMFGMTFKEKDERKIPIGSVKANIGHLADGAASIVALIKVLLCFQENMIPPAINFSEPNPDINWNVAPVYVNTSLQVLQPCDGKSPRYASISSFGLLGTNVHVVVREHSPAFPSITKLLTDTNTKSDETQILALAANSKQSLTAFVLKLVQYFETSSSRANLLLKRVCFTLNLGREHARFQHRAVAYSNTWNGMMRSLKELHCELSNSALDRNTVKSDYFSGYATRLSKSCCNALKLQSPVAAFLQGDTVSWEGFFSDADKVGLTKLPLMPTYAFDRSRYWPNITKPINEELLQLKHTVCTSDHYTYQDKTKESNTFQKCCFSNRVDDVNLLLANVLNEALGENLNWKGMEHENLFSLGVDSLIYTHVNLKLKDSLDLPSPLTMTELHDNPSFRAVCDIVIAKLNRLNAFETSKNVSSLKSSNTSKLFPVSFAQRRLWVMQEMAINPCAYNATNCLKITGDFHPAAFVLAVNTVLSRHGAFCTHFVDSVDGPMQTHNFNLQIVVEESNLESFGDEAESIAMDLYRKEYETPFDLRQGPLVRCKLYCLPQNKYYFTIVVHHIIFDGWSHFVFYNELWESYTSALEGKQIESDIHMPLYSHLTKEEQIYLQSSVSMIENDLSYWKKQFVGSLPHTTLPGDKRRPPVFSHNGGRLTRFINDAVIKNIQKLIADNSTMFMTLLSAIYILIYRYTGDKDLVIGTPVAGRTELKSKHVIGCFVNTLALRVQLQEKFTFRDVLEAVSKVSSNAYDHQLAPFDCLVSQLNLPRDTSITPIFSINVCYHNTEMRAEHVSVPSGLQVERKLLHNNSAKWDLYFDFLQEPEGMRFTLEYYSEVFSNRYAECIAESFLTLLVSITQHPSIPISELNICLPSSKDKEENKQILSSIIHGPFRNLGTKLLPVLLLENLKLYAEDSIIVDSNGKSMKYGELLVKAERLAIFLREFCRIQKQSKIGLLVENSSEALQSIIACVISGLIHVPIDANSNKFRLQHICKEAEVSAIIFNKQYLALANCLQWACPSVKMILCVDGDDFQELQENAFGVPLMDNELWNCVASNAEDDIEGGGWKSSYTGQHFSIEEMNEYTKNVSEKLHKYLSPACKVLEIGCASGLTTQAICPLVGYYFATDLSEQMIKRLEKKLLHKGVRNVELSCIPADQVSQVFHHHKFDIIIMNSVVHCFPGHSYLHRVFNACEELLSENGVIFIGDIMDQDLQEELIISLKTFKDAHPKYRVKTEWHNELFLSRKFIRYLCHSSTTLKKVSCSRKIYSIANELTKFRYDALFTKSSSIDRFPNEIEEFGTCALNDVTNSLESKYRNTDDLHRTAYELATEINLHDEVYILYTSGTTGLPRGVIIGQVALLNYVTWAKTAYKFDDTVTIPMFSPITFDFTLTSIFPPLLGGSTILFFKHFQESYLTMIAHTQITTMKLSPIQLDVILSATKLPLSASTFIIGGEELTSTLLAKLKKNKLCSDFVVWNEYGPTEVTVGCVVKRFFSEDLPLDQSDFVSIGQPIDNVTIAVVGDNFKSVPVGGKGTLSIGGRCLCSDFVGSGPTKVANRRKYFAAACWGRPGEQMLLTDDIVEMMPICELAYFGRKKDCNTTKVNGIRVDLLEIQHAIENTYLIESAWVCSFVYKCHTYLGAAVKLKSESLFSNQSWKPMLTSSLAQSLPARSIPNVLVDVSAPPINANGKKNIPFLQQLFIEHLLAGNEKSSEKPGVQMSETSISTTVSRLQKIWRGILPVNHLPHPDENFFLDLSGDSLQAIHLIRKMRDEGFKISIADIFQNPSINKLLPILQSNAGNDSNMEHQFANEQENVKFQPTPIVEEYLNRSPPLNHPDHFALSALLRFNSKLEIKLLQTALRSVMKKHQSLHSKFEVSDGGTEQQVIELDSDEPKVTEIFIVKEHEHLSSEPAFSALCQQLEESHSLSKGILVNAAIITSAETVSCPLNQKEESNLQVYALIAIHHAVTDTVSWQQILDDLATALRQLSENDSSEPVLQKSMLPFSTFCQALHAEASSGIFTEEISYWKAIEKQCMESGVVSQHNILGRFKSAKWTSKALDASLLLSTATKLGCSHEQILLTAFGRALSSVHGKDKTAVCLESHGRQLANLDSTDTVGWCTSKFPFILDTPKTKDFVSQVKLISEMLNGIPNRGLGFGLLKSAGKVKISYPKIMFVFQGSLDASNKEAFNGGDFKFEHIPWIEVVLHDLKDGNFHRHLEEILEFDLEMISWIHGGMLKIGYLFDKELISESLVEDVMNSVANNLSFLAKRTKDITKAIKLEVIPGLTISPECIEIIKDALWHHRISVDEMIVYPFEQALQSLYVAGKAVDVTIIIPGLELNNQTKEFLETYDKCRNLRMDRDVVIITTKAISSNAKFPAKLLPEKSKIIQLPDYISELFSDSKTHEQYSMPFTQIGYAHFGLFIARIIRATIFNTTYKVIAVDADYTLWNGECAEGIVTFNHGNVILHKFLLKMKKQGMSLVILSKNNIQDVEAVFEIQKNKMTLNRDDFVFICANWEQKATNIMHVSQLLNLGLDTFVFIDDSSLECETMIESHPEVFTLQFPSEQQLVSPLLDSLWLLDKMCVTSETANKTEMYQDEFAQQKEVKNIENVDYSANTFKLLELPLQWKMKLTLCKTTVASLKHNEKLFKRATELLHRTTQFKLNNVNIKLNDARDEDYCWLISLEDRHGSYGIISVVLLSKCANDLFVNEWVLSCRALGRQVEQRILYEITNEAKSNCLQLAVNQTGRNIPCLEFLKSLNIECSGLSLMYITVDSFNLPKSVEKIHQIQYLADLDEFSENVYPVEVLVESHGKLALTSAHCVMGYREINQWIDMMWSSSQKQQSIRHDMFPIIPPCEYLIKDDLKHVDGETLDRQVCLKLAWMEVLHTKLEPEDSDNFFTCGGNSFFAIFLVSKLQRICGIDISIMDVLQNPNYSEFKYIVLHAKTTREDKKEVRQLNEKIVSLSATQQRMVMMQMSAPGSTAYVETISCFTRNRINSQDILKDLVKEHPILKSRIEIDTQSQRYIMISNDEGEGAYAVQPEAVEDMETAADFLRRSIPSIDILSTPLAIFRHLKAGDFTILVLHIHQLIIDDVTLKQISQDLLKLMGESSLKRNAVANSASFASFINSEDSYFRSSKYDIDGKFWKDMFATLPPDVNLAILPKTVSTWSDTNIYSATNCYKCIPPETVEEITSYCNALAVTQFQFYLSCTSLVVQRYLGVNEITFAIPVTTRTDIYQYTDGLFINTVLFRIVVDPSMTLREYIKTVAESWLKTLSHSQYPLDQVTDRLWKEHGKSANSFCCVMFNYSTCCKYENELKVHSKHAKTPLSLNIIYNEEESIVELQTEWAVELVNDEIAVRLTDGIVKMYSKALKATDSKLLDIDSLSPLEHELLKSFNLSHDAYNPKGNMLIFKAFEEHVVQNPDAISVICNNTLLSYNQLNEMANRIAHGLYKYVDTTSLKSKPVVIVMNENEYVIASILGIWKAGGHFLPVALSNQNCLQDIFKRSVPAAVLFNVQLDSISSIVKNFQTCPMLDVKELTKDPSEDFQVMLMTSEDDLAYIIQTSGSTGTPKQCKISHKSLGCIANAWKEEYKMNTFKVNVLQWAPLSFDVFVGDVTRALVCAQGQLVMCPDMYRLDVPYIINLIKKHKITMSEVTPQFGLQLVENASIGDLDSLKLLILGSDILQCHLYERVKGLLRKDQRLINSYGMTEATIDSSFFEGDHLPPTRSGAVPIGKPLPGVNFHILDSKTLQVCPIGTIGELCISGPVLGKGDVKLVPVKHLQCHALMTGDAACWLPSGNVELLGRLDNMVKLRGFRISTAEIENELVKSINGIKDTCVVPMTSNDSGIQFLCAFVVPNENCNLDRQTICNQLKLPYYMLPDIVHIIDEIPLTAHGKVNHRALPKVSEVLVTKPEIKITNCSEYPATSTLKKLFAEAMGMSDSNQIHSKLTFTEQGGHSLILIHFCSLIKQKTTFNVGIADIFSHPSITSLAEYICNENTRNETDDYQPVEGEFDGNIESQNLDDVAITASLSRHEMEEELSLLMFPGQGAQKVGMIRTMKGVPEAEAIFRRGEQVLGYNVLEICLKDSFEVEEKLKSMEFVQVSLLTGCIAKLEQLKIERPDILHKVTHVAGLSVGEFAALVYVNAMSFEDALRLVQLRGKVMEDEVKQSLTGMVSVFGPTLEQLQEFLEHSFPRMQISTFLADNQHTVAGTEEDCDALVDSLIHTEYKQQINVIDVRKLQVAGAFHSSYMKKAAEKVDPVIDMVQFLKPSIPIIMNVYGQFVVTPDEIKSSLKEQLVSPVQWKQSMLTAFESGVRSFIEVGPSRVLSSIAKKGISECKDCSVDFIVV